MNKKLQEIIKKNAEFEKKSPYNFCDRWCERCNFEKQKACMLFQDDLDRRLTNIGRGKDPEDLEILEEDLSKQFGLIEEAAKKWGIEEDFDFIDEGDYKNWEKKEEDKEKQLFSSSLYKVTHQYTMKTRDFLKETLCEKFDIPSDLKYDYDTVIWYHTLLSAKMYRALCGLYAEDKIDDEEDFELCDAIAQLAICKKAIMLSIRALRNIVAKNNNFQQKIINLLVLLRNIFSQIKILEDEIA